jgi:hypothetical protein
MRVNQAEGIATDTNFQYLNPLTHTPPLGVKINILTIGGVNIQGMWPSAWKEATSPEIAWAPLLSTPAWAKKKIYDRYVNSEKKSCQSQCE